MFFLKKKSRATAPQVEKPEVEDNALLNTENKEETPQETVDQQLDGTPTTLFKKMFSFPVPESSYENESWAPEYEPVGLFRKRRASFEEADSAKSDAQ